MVRTCVLPPMWLIVMMLCSPLMSESLSDLQQSEAMPKASCGVACSSGKKYCCEDVITGDDKDLISQLAYGLDEYDIDFDKPVGKQCSKVCNTSQTCSKKSLCCQGPEKDASNLGLNLGHVVFNCEKSA